jgi:broad specificity phosphatase PhoE
MAGIYLVRHGTTDWNQGEIFRGRLDIQLNEAGRAEARALASRLQNADLRGVFSSPLSRAKETAQAVAEAKGLEVTPDAAFVDLDFGDWQGLPVQRVKTQYPDLYRLWVERPQEVTFPGGENLARAKTRSWEGFLRLFQEHEEETILIVSHRVITKLLLCSVLGIGESHFWKIRQEPAAINRIDFLRGRFVASLINDTCHLESSPLASGRKDF